MKFIKCSNIDEMAKISALDFKNIILNNKYPILGMATGSTPIATYKELIKLNNSDEISFENVSTFNLDEYVDLKEEYKKNSYREYMNNNLFNYINIDKKNTFFPYEHINHKIDITKKDYSEYDNLINSKGGIDLLILGIGNNGHIGFNEPGSNLNSKTRLIELDESTRKANSRFFNNKISDVPKYAISMGLSTILKSKKIILLVVGESKKEALSQLLNSKEFNKDWPCTSLLLHNDVTIYYIE